MKMVYGISTIIKPVTLSIKVHNLGTDLLSIENNKSIWFALFRDFAGILLYILLMADNNINILNY